MDEGDRARRGDTAVKDDDRDARRAGGLDGRREGGGGVRGDDEDVTALREQVRHVRDLLVVLAAGIDVDELLDESGSLLDLHLVLHRVVADDTPRVVHARVREAHLVRGLLLELGRVEHHGCDHLQPRRGSVTLGGRAAGCKLALALGLVVELGLLGAGTRAGGLGGGRRGLAGRGFGRRGLAGRGFGRRGCRRRSSRAGGAGGAARHRRDGDDAEQRREASRHPDLLGVASIAQGLELGPSDVGLLLCAGCALATPFAGGRRHKRRRR